MTERDRELEVEWPAPRDDPDEEPTEPWARPDGTSPNWDRIRREVKRRGVEAQGDAES